MSKCMLHIYICIHRHSLWFVLCHSWRGCRISVHSGVEACWILWSGHSTVCLQRFDCSTRFRLHPAQRFYQLSAWPNSQLYQCLHSGRHREVRKRLFATYAVITIKSQLLGSNALSDSKNKQQMILINNYAV